MLLLYCFNIMSFFYVKTKVRLVIFYSLYVKIDSAF